MYSKLVVTPGLRPGVYSELVVVPGLRPGVYSELVVASHFGLEKRYLLPDGSQVHVAPHTLGGKAGICDRLCLRYMPGFVFWVGKQVPVADTHRSTYFGLVNKVPATCHASGTCLASYFGWQDRYRWQVHVAPCVLGG